MTGRLHQACWLPRVLRARGVMYPGGLLECDGPMDWHHVLPKQRIKRVSPDPYVRRERLDDPRDQVAVCRRHHDLLERRLVVLRPGEIPAEAREFAAELGLEHVLDDYVCRGSGQT